RVRVTIGGMGGDFPFAVDHARRNDPSTRGPTGPTIVAVDLRGRSKQHSFGAASVSIGDRDGVVAAVDIGDVHAGRSRGDLGVGVHVLVARAVFRDLHVTAIDGPERSVPVLNRSDLATYGSAFIDVVGDEGEVERWDRIADVLQAG